MSAGATDAYLAVLRRDEVEAVRRLWQADPSLVEARGHFRTDGMILSIQDDPPVLLAVPPAQKRSAGRQKS